MTWILQNTFISNPILKNVFSCNASSNKHYKTKLNQTFSFISAANANRRIFGHYKWRNEKSIRRWFFRFFRFFVFLFFCQSNQMKVIYADYNVKARRATHKVEAKTKQKTKTDFFYFWKFCDWNWNKHSLTSKMFWENSQDFNCLKIA